jgi:hypothetical protein
MKSPGKLVAIEPNVARIEVKLRPQGMEDERENVMTSPILAVMWQKTKHSEQTG